MSPAEPSKAQCFAVKRGEINQRLNVEFYRGEYTQFLHSLRKHYPDIRPLGSYGEIVCGPFGTSIKLGDYVTDGVPLLRISNITDQGNLDIQGVVFITPAKSKKMASTQVTEGDLVISQRGTLGVSAVVSSEYPAFNISANLIAVRGLTGLLPRFVQLYLSSRLGERQISRLQSGQVHAKITTNDIASILIPNVSNQAELIHTMDTARAGRKAKLAKAKALLAGLDDFLLDALGIAPPNTPRITFAVRTKDLTGVINPARYRSLQIEKQLPFKNTIGVLGSLIEGKVSPAKEASEQQFDLVRIDDLPNQPWQVESVRTVTGKNLEGAFFEVQENDILVARLGPAILNAKFVLCPKLERRTIASGEFLVLRCNENYHPEAVLWILRTALYRRMMYLRSRGATPSRFRLNGSDLLAIPFPEMDDTTQSSIAAEVRRRRENARRLRFEAEADWLTAKSWFEKQLLGPASL